MLCRCQSKAIEAHDAVIEESAAGSARVIPAVLKTNAGTSFPVGNPVFDRAGYCFHGLQKARPAAIVIPRDLQPDRRAPALVECPVHWQTGPTSTRRADFQRWRLSLPRSGIRRQSSPGRVSIRRCCRKENARTASRYLIGGGRTEPPVSM